MKTLIANWKMNHTISDGLHFIQQLLQFKPDISNVKVLIAPSFVSIYPLQQEIKKSGSPLSICAQNIHWDTNGAYTGEVSAEMIRSAGCSSVLIGHSERRLLFLETNDVILKKFKAALDHEIMPFVCFGEPFDVYQRKDTFSYVTKQLEMFPPNQEFYLAYEPIWSIGTGLIPSSEEIQDVITYVKNLFPHAKILYGGSVNQQNIALLSSIECIDGFLIGGASLFVESFVFILNAVIKAET